MNAISRRAFLQRTSVATAATWVGASSFGSLIAQQPADELAAFRAEGLTAKITVQAARRNVSALLGSGGNIAVLTGKDGKLLVDSGYATSRPQITEALGGLGSDPVKHLVDTHWHFDHTDRQRVAAWRGGDDHRAREYEEAAEYATGDS